MLPTDTDTRIVWGYFVISRYRAGQDVHAIVSEARIRGVAMSRDDVLEILRKFVDRFDRDVQITREGVDR